MSLLLMMVGSVFVLGLVGVVVNSSSVMSLLLSFEVMLMSVNLGLVLYSLMGEEMSGMMTTLWVLCVSAGEASMGLALFVKYYSVSGEMGMSLMNQLSG